MNVVTKRYKGNSIEDVGRIAQECYYEKITNGNSTEDVGIIANR